MSSSQVRHRHSTSMHVHRSTQGSTASLPDQGRSTDIGLSATTLTLTAPKPTSTSNRSSSESYPLSSQTTTTNSTPAASLTPSSVPVGQQTHHGISSSSLAAAIAVPVVVVALVLIGLFVILGRRKRSRGANRTSHTPMSFLSPIKEKVTGRGSDQSSPKHSRPAAASLENRTYFTGLETSSTGSPREQNGDYTSTSMIESPPPYQVQNAAGTVPQSRDVPMAASQDARAIPVRHGENLAPVDRTDTRSISSTLYSDTASVHSARAARRSIGAAHMIAPEGLVQTNPFIDPNTPIGSLTDSNLNPPT